jgi:hypothetical protein
VFVAGLETAGGYDVDRVPEELLQFVLEVEEVEQGAARLELDEEVDVAGLVVIPPSDRAEDGDRSPSVPVHGVGDRSSVLLDQGTPTAHRCRG